MTTRSLFLLVAAACGCGGGSTSTTADAPGPVDRYEIRGSCAHPLGPGGEVAFPDTAAGAQTSVRPIDVINAGERAIVAAEYMHWEVVGPDAAEFSVENTSNSFDLEMCAMHQMIPVPFAVGGSCRIDVLFHPTAAGAKQAMLHVTQGLGATIDQTFPIRANAVAAPQGLYASAPDLYVKPANPFDRQGFMIVNGGTTSIDLGQPIATPPFLVDPQAAWSCPSPLTPGGACRVNAIGVVSTASGCPVGAFKTTTAALEVPLSARYVPSTFSLDPPVFGSVRVDPLGATCTAQSSGCQYTFNEPTALTLTAVPDPGAHFLGWYQPGGQLAPCGTAATCKLAPGFANLSLSARFASAQAKAIAVTIAGTGTVSGPPGSCSTSCTLWAEPGSLVLTETTPGAFVGWSGDCTGTAQTCNLGTVINDRAVTATFSP